MKKYEVIDKCKNSHTSYKGYTVNFSKATQKQLKRLLELNPNYSEIIKVKDGDQ